MTIIITDGNGTDVHAYDEEHLFVSHPYHDAKVARYIERVRSDLESENETEVFTYSFGRDSNLRSLDPPWD
jgi:hypothetical protein